MNQPSQQESREPPIVRMAKGQEVGLTWAALFYIAFIVFVCSGAGRTVERTVNVPVGVNTAPLERHLDSMDGKLQEIEKKLDDLAKKAKKE